MSLMNNMFQRAETFYKISSLWSSELRSLIIPLAAAGFKHLACNTTICVYCNVTKDNWTIADDPKVVHLQLNPECSGIKTSWGCEQFSPFDTLTLGTQLELEPNNQAVLKKRIMSFNRNWPYNFINSKFSPEIMAKAGFVYIGIHFEDEVICTSCGCNISNWCFKQSPTKEHIKYVRKNMKFCSVLYDRVIGIDDINIDDTNMALSLSKIE
uniref:ORF68 n=1 Tax=Malaco herpesvirus 2 TaxID=3031798 RepID=A0AA48P7M0_9VIRU|nr:TPA_asm: ORF68 [Malaco herpesvirus 2]